MHGLRALPSAAIALSIFACAPATDAGRSAPHDRHSAAEPTQVRVTHLELDLELDFSARSVGGRATWRIERTQEDAPLVLDTDSLEIEAVRGGDGEPRPWHLREARGDLGRALVVELEEGDGEVEIDYHTGPGSAALRFLDPEETPGDHPFLFTVGQPIRTRSWIPCQDSPAVRVTFGATVIAPRPLTVLMGATRRAGPLEVVHDDGPDPRRGLWRFRMEQAIPSHLISLACGELAEGVLSERSSLWAAPSVLAAAKDELAEVERMLELAEELCGSYRWGRHDLLLLPQPLPSGGLANPTLTCVTSTLLAGDPSPASVVAHELAHAWAGNLVTHATWNDLWLSEGLGVYLGERIVEALHGVERAREEQIDRRNDLTEALERLEPWRTALHLDLEERHPEEGFGAVPSVKGALFLRRLEQAVGRGVLDHFLRAWFDEHAFESVTTEDLVDFVAEHLPSAAGAVDLEEWLEGRGLPSDAPQPPPRDD